MANFLKSLFGGKPEDPLAEKERNNKKNFEIFKYDGLRAQRMGQLEYAIKCFNEALSIEEDFETMSYLTGVQVQLGKLEEARLVLEQMSRLEPELASTYLTLANVCFMQEDYENMKTYAGKAIELDNENPVSYLLLAKAERGLKDEFAAIAHLTQAISAKENYTEAYLMRAEILQNMQQYVEAMKDVGIILAHTPDDESALLLRGKLKEATGNTEEARKDYTEVTELNPFNEQAYLYLGQLLIAGKEFDKAIECFNEAIEINPGFAQAYYERGRVKLLKGDKEGSVEDMKKSLELNPEDENNISGQFDNFKNLYANIPL